MIFRWIILTILVSCRPHTIHELKNFFEDYKKLENKKVEVMGFKGKEEAWKCIEESMERYRQQVKPHVIDNNDAN